MTRILIVEDEHDIAELWRWSLEKAGYEVDVRLSGSEGLAAILERPPDLVILDWMLPGMSGLEICQAVRNNPKTAATLIIMATARGEESDRITGLEMGTDDYMPKPFSPKELVLHVRARLRQDQRQLAPNNRITYGSIVVDAERHIVSSNGAEVALTAKEFLLLQYLLSHRGRVLSRDVLLTEVWELRYTGGTRTVDVHVRRLREKLPALGDALVTVKQFGYKLLDQPPGSADA